MGRLTALCLAAALLAAAPAAFGQDRLTNLNVETRERLCDIKSQVATVESLAEAGALPAEAAATATAHLLETAGRVAGNELTRDQLMSVTEPSAWDRFLGWTDLFMWIAVATFVICVLIVAFGQWLVFLVKMFAHIPREAWEILLGLSGVGLAVWGYFLDRSFAEWVGLAGCLLAGGVIIESWARLNRKKSMSLAFGAVALIAGAAAAAYASTMIGYLAVAALVSALGFSVIAMPGCYCFGFNDDDSVGRATTAGLLMVAAYVALDLLGDSAAALQPFKSGALFFGSFVGLLGLLIVSSKWYVRDRTTGGRSSSGNYWAMQVIAVGFMVAATFLGTVYGIESLQPVGGTFLMFYLAEKTCEIPVGDRLIGFAYRGILASGVVIGLIWLARAHPETIGPYLVF